MGEVENASIMCFAAREERKNPFQKRQGSSSSDHDRVELESLPFDEYVICDPRNQRQGDMLDPSRVFCFPIAVTSGRSALF